MSDTKEVELAKRGVEAFVDRANELHHQGRYVEALKQLEGEKYKFSWQLDNALAQKSKYWKMSGGGLKNKLKDREIKEKLKYL